VAPSPAKYRQIAADLRARIECGEYEVGSQLPVKLELGQSYGAAGGTIDRALGLLRGLGMVESRQGMGTFVLRQHAEAQDDAGPVQRQMAELADRVESLELSVRDLYSRQGADYPDGKAVAHGGRA
jgi:DNA-binding GntR family transcriptional regulator